jgi:hypothetical protein
MITIGPSSCLVSQEVVEPTPVRWLACNYNGKSRVGLDLGDDKRPGTNNRVWRTLDGIRTFNKTKIKDIVDVTILGD